MKNPLSYLKEEEINAMPLVDLEVTKSVSNVKEQKIKRTSYSARLIFDRLTFFRTNISSDDFALLTYYADKDKDFVENQFTVPVHVRIVETQWPEKGEIKAHSRFEMQIYVNERLGYRFDITNSSFLDAYQVGRERGKLKEFDPVIRIPGKLDKEEKIVEPSELQEAPGEEEFPPEDEKKEN